MLVPAITDKLPVQVEFVPGTTVEVSDHKEGGTNKWIKVKTQLMRPKDTVEQKRAREDADKDAAEEVKPAADQAEKAADEAEKATR